MKKTLVKSLALAVIGTAMMAGSAMATVIMTITDDNSTALVDTNSGMTSWSVDGTNHLYYQGFWYGIGDNAEHGISTLGLLASGTTDTNFDGSFETAYVRYGSDTSFWIEVTYGLIGGNPGTNTADIAETIKITNKSTATITDFRLYQYSDFDLNGTATDDYIARTNANTVRQWDSMSVFGETVITPTPSHWQIDNFTFVSSLNDTVKTHLTDQSSPYGPGDGAWAYEWDFNLAENGNYIISKDKNLAPVPEPATMLLLGTGIAGLVGAARRRVAKKA